VALATKRPESLKKKDPGEVAYLHYYAGDFLLVPLPSRKPKSSIT
jgi:hypothetical protein